MTVVIHQRTKIIIYFAKDQGPQLFIGFGLFVICRKAVTEEEFLMLLPTIKFCYIYPQNIYFEISATYFILLRCFRHKWRDYERATKEKKENKSF